MKDYEYNKKRFCIELTQEKTLKVSRDNYSTVISVKDAKGNFKLICPDTDKELGLADDPEKAIDSACSIILGKMQIAEKERDALTRLSMFYHSQLPDF